MDDWLTQPAGLATRLRELRKAAGLTGERMAAAAGWTQSKISKIETGRQLPTDDDLQTWASACQLDDTGVAELRSLLAETLGMSREWRQQMRLGQASIQRGYDDLVRSSGTIRNFEVSLIPGLLQVPGYARSRLEENVRVYGAEASGVDAALAERAKRQDVLRYNNKSFKFIISEACLRYFLSTPDVMLAQQVRLLELTAPPPHITFGIIPFHQPLTVAPQNGFLLLDNIAIVESFVGEAMYHGEEALAYLAFFEGLAAQAVYGQDARTIILAAIDATREMIRPPHGAL